MIDLASKLRSSIYSPMKMVEHIWNYDYTDFRIIYEQSDELHYFYVKSRTQRIIAKTFVVTSLLLIAFITSLMIHSGFSVWRYDRLEASKIEAENKKQEAIEALAVLSDSDPAYKKNLSQDELLAMAKTYKDRLKKTKLLVQYSSQELVQANKALEAGLKAAGMNRMDIDKVLKDKSKTGASGGPSEEMGFGGKKDLNDYKNGLDENQSIKEFISALPTNNPVQGAFITSKFGPRIHPVTGKLTFHEGLDFVPSFDQYAKTVLPGVVESVDFDPEGYGRMVIVSHLRGIKTLYGHLDTVSVSRGQQVNAGAALGKIGNTGLSTGKHLHFEVLVRDTKVNPSIIMAMAKNVQ